MPVAKQIQCLRYGYLALFREIISQKKAGFHENDGGGSKENDGNLGNKGCDLIIGKRVKVMRSGNMVVLCI